MKETNGEGGVWPSVAGNVGKSCFSDCLEFTSGDQPAGLSLRVFVFDFHKPGVGGAWSRLLRLKIVRVETFCSIRVFPGSRSVFCGPTSSNSPYLMPFSVTFAYDPTKIKT